MTLYLQLFYLPFCVKYNYSCLICCYSYMKYYLLPDILVQPIPNVELPTSINVLSKQLQTPSELYHPIP